MGQTLFLSYSWMNSGFADKIDTAFQPTGIYVRRDVREIGFKGSIKDYMQQIRESDFALILISDHFLKSINCMYEVLELTKEVDFKSKIIPIIIDGTKIFKPEDKLEYIKYWASKFDELESKLKLLSTTDALDLYKELKHIQNIKGSIGEFLSYMSEINLLFFSQLESKNFKPIFDYIGVSDDALIKRILSLTSYNSSEERDIELDKLEEEYPQNSKVYFVKAYSAFSKQQIEKSNYFYEKSITLDSNFSPSYYNLGYNKDTYDKDFEEAERLYKKAIELNPFETRAMINLGRLYSNELNKPNQARELYERVLNINPYEESGHFNLAYLLHTEFEDFDRAKYHYEIAIKISPNAGSLHNYGMLLWKHFKNYNEAKKQFLSALEIEPLRKYTLKQLGLLFEREYKHISTAKTYFDRFIKIEPNDAEDHYFYATFLMLHFLKSEKAIARYHYDEACKLDQKFQSKHAEVLLQ